MFGVVFGVEKGASFALDFYVIGTAFDFEQNPGLWRGLGAEEEP